MTNEKWFILHGAWWIISLGFIWVQIVLQRRTEKILDEATKTLDKLMEAEKNEVRY